MTAVPARGSRILLVDDEPDLLETLNEWLACFGYDTRVAANGLEALSLVQGQAFDVVITDLKMPGLNGLQLLSLLKDHDPSIEVIFLTGQGTMEDSIQALREGRAFDFLQKPLKDLRQLNVVIEKALARRRVATQVLVAPVRQAAAMPLPEHVEPLTEREVEIVSLLAQGLDNREIADRLLLSEKTIKNHLTRVYEKLKVSNRTQAVVLCQQLALI